METRSLHSPAHKALIDWLRLEREKKGLSVRTLAEKAGTFHSLIVKVEQAERDLSVVEYVQYCEALGIKPEDGLKLIKKSLGI